MQVPRQELLLGAIDAGQLARRDGSQVVSVVWKHVAPGRHGLHSRQTAQLGCGWSAGSVTDEQVRTSRRSLGAGTVEGVRSSMRSNTKGRMPRIVDHDQRRQECADALWRVVSRDGAGAISVRSVAAEAGMSPTNLTHYFPSRAEMLAAVIRRHLDLGIAAVAEIGSDVIVIEQAVEMLMAAIPTTPTRRRQSEVWMLLVHERSASEVADRLLQEVQQTVFRGVLEGLDVLERSGLLGSGRHVADEAHRLHALIDGLSLQSLCDPVGMSEGRVRRLVTQHLSEIARPLD